jgi:murein DD-endopeptidase MepM/ murein hydrolase activator NlpD
MKSITAVAVAVVLSGAAGVATAARPWPARKPAVTPKPAHQLRTVTTWPAEPASPTEVDAARFQAAFAHLCSVPADGAVAALAPAVFQAARDAAVDPFLLAALAAYGSGCDPAFNTTASGAKHAADGVGLLGIDATPYLAPGGPPLPVARAALSRRQLLDPANNLAVGAHLLKMWEDSHVEIDATFGSVPHRSAVSHLVWGDDVRSSGHEDLILTARRRLVTAYAGAPEAPRATPLGIAVVSPLEATPRVATSGPGDERDGGARRHRGLDITAIMGEPVRAIADGDVIFAGANLPGRPRKDDIPPTKIARYARRRLGVGGIYLCIEHDDVRRVVSCYMHLASYVISKGDHVSAGQTIGFVGRTGVKVSPPHLHLEVRVEDRFTNPLRTLGDLVIPPKATQTYRYVQKARRARLRAALPSPSHAS